MVSFLGEQNGTKWSQFTCNSFRYCADADNIAELLIANGANVNAVNDIANSPLDFAASFGEYNWYFPFEFNQEKGFFLFHVVLSHFYWKGGEKVAKVLLDNGAEANSRGQDGLFPIHSAAKFGIIFRWLFESSIYFTQDKTNVFLFGFTSKATHILWSC